MSSSSSIGKFSAWRSFKKSSNDWGFIRLEFLSCYVSLGYCAFQDVAPHKFHPLLRKIGNRLHLLGDVSFVVHRLAALWIGFKHSTNRKSSGPSCTGMKPS